MSAARYRIVKYWTAGVVWFKVQSRNANGDWWSESCKPTLEEAEKIAEDLSKNPPQPEEIVKEYP